MQIVTSIQQLAAFRMAGRTGRVIPNTPFIAAYATVQADF
jgi:hypothetical protein